MHLTLHALECYAMEPIVCGNLRCNYQLIKISDLLASTKIIKRMDGEIIQNYRVNLKCMSLKYESD